MLFRLNFAMMYMCALAARADVHEMKRWLRVRVVFCKIYFPVGVLTLLEMGEKKTNKGSAIFTL